MYQYITKSKRIIGDLCTPVSVYLKVRDAYPQSALMESSDYHGGENAKSFIALHPIASVSISHGIGRAQYPDGSVSEHPITETYGSAQVINDFLQAFHVEGDQREYCGLFGYTSFRSTAACLATLRSTPCDILRILT